MEKATITTVAKLENLNELVDFAANHAEEFGLGMKRIVEVNLAVEEAVVNVFNYAYPYEVGNVEISCEGEDDSFFIEIVDSGTPFNVLTLPDPDITASIEERNMGGLGVFFIRKLMDAVSYRWEEGKNILRLTVRKGTPA